MNHYNISVIIPNYNRKEELIRAIESALKQTYSPIEIIVVDDQSNFDIKTFLDNSFNCSSQNIKLHINKKNSGAAKSRNIGIDLSKGDYIAFLDSDDYWLEEKLEKQISLFKKNNTLDLVYTDQTLDKNGTLSNSGKTLINSNLLKHLTDFWTAPNTSTLLFKKSSLNAIGGFNTSLSSCQDHDLWFRLAIKNMQIDYVNGALSIFVLESKDRISLNLKKRMTGVKAFLKNWKDVIIKESNFFNYQKFKSQYFYFSCYPIFVYYIRNKQYPKAIKIYFRYLILNSNFYKRLFELM